MSKIGSSSSVVVVVCMPGDWWGVFGEPDSPRLASRFS